MREYVGGLTAFLAHNKQDEITTCWSPGDLQRYVWCHASLYALSTRLPTEREFTFPGHSCDHDYEIRVRDTSLLGQKLELNGFFFKLADGSSRFFGFNAKSQHRWKQIMHVESGYTIAAGYTFGRYFRCLSVTVSATSESSGAFKNLPDIKENFHPQPCRVLTVLPLMPCVSLSYSTLDIGILLPMAVYPVYLEPTMKALGGRAITGTTRLKPKGLSAQRGKYISVLRLKYDQTLVPMSLFGAEYPGGGEFPALLRPKRFMTHFLLCNIEERIRLFRGSFRGVTADWKWRPLLTWGLCGVSGQGKRFRLRIYPGIVSGRSYVRICRQSRWESVRTARRCVGWGILFKVTLPSYPAPISTVTTLLQGL